MTSTLLVVASMCSTPLQEPAIEVTLEMKRVMSTLVRLSQLPRQASILSEIQSETKLPRVESQRSGRWILRHGGTTVAYTVRGEFFSYIAGPSLPTSPAQTRSDESLVADVKAALSEIRHWGSEVEYDFVVRRENGRGPEVNAIPLIGGMQCNHGGYFTFDAQSQFLKSVRLWDRLDYSRYRNAERITQEEATAVAISAYTRFNPFSVVEIKGPALMFGAPMLSQQSPPTHHEMTTAELDELRSYVAFPMYVFYFDNEGDARADMRQVVYVNAASGRAMIIEQESGRSYVRQQLTWTGPVVYSFQDSRGEAIGSARRGQEAAQSGMPVVLRMGERYVGLTYDRDSKTLFLKESKGVFAYHPDKLLQKHLASLPKPGKKFGS